MLLLATVWVLLVMQVPTETMKHPVELEIQNVEFASIADCDAAARKWMPDMTAAAYARKRAITWGLPAGQLPEGATVTITCIERKGD